MEEECEVLIVGGGCGGVAAALSSARLGRRVVLTESMRTIGGQLTSQAVPPDEHPWVETTGVTPDLSPAAGAGEAALLGH